LRVENRGLNLILSWFGGRGNAGFTVLFSQAGPGQAAEDKQFKQELLLSRLPRSFFFTSQRAYV
jgi:hypothetical protein